MAKKTMRYEDTVVASGSNLYAALEAGDKKLAKKLYKESKAEFEKYFGKNWKSPLERDTNEQSVDE